MPKIFKVVQLFRSTNQLTKVGFFSPVRQFFASRSFSTKGAYEARLVPPLSIKSKAILPISMGRYDGDKVKRAQYDKDIDTLLKFTAEGLETGSIGSMEVLSTAGLQELNWSKEKAKEIEDHFMSTHHKMLEKQTGFYTWNGFISKIGEKRFEDNYHLVKTASSVGSHWHELMLKTHQAVTAHSDIETSLEYQRREYAIILSMKGTYTNIAYLGNISLAWSYLYQSYKDIPIFTRVIIDKTKKKVDINTIEANSTVGMVLRNIEEVLVNENFPKKEKIKLADAGTSLFQAYVRRDDDKDAQLHTENKDGVASNRI